jgi:signal transduction histidine kinase
VTGVAGGPRPTPMVDYATQKWGGERLIAAVRLLMVDVAFLALSADPGEPTRYARFAYTAVLTYGAYALLAAIHAWITDGLTRRRAMTMHVIDLAAALVVVAFTDGSTSPFFVFLVFPLLPAALRWGWWGTTITAVVASAGYVGVGLQEVFVLHDPRFALNEMLMRVVHIAVLATVLGTVAAYQDRSRRSIAALAAWAAPAAPDDDEFHPNLLGHVASTLKAPRVVLLWRATEGTTTTAVEWVEDSVKQSSEAPDAWEKAVVGRVRETHFLSTRAHRRRPRVMYAAPGGFERWRGSAVTDVFRARYAPRSILSFRLRGDGIVGRLFVLDKRRLTIDDFTLGALVAQQAANSVEHRAALQRLRDEAVLEERGRIARDVHDQVLQSLTALSLGLETVARLIALAPERAAQPLAELQARLSGDQRTLRTAVHGLRRRDGPPPQLGRQLSELVRNLEQEWGVPVKLDLKLRDIVVPDSVGREVRLIVREGVVNAARHAHPTLIYVTASGDEDGLTLTIDDNGRGFAFSGRVEDAERRERRLGPAVLGERVEALGGSLAITSDVIGSRLDIRIPLG